MFTFELPGYFLPLFIVLYLFPWVAARVVWWERRRMSLSSRYVFRLTQEQVSEFESLLSWLIVPGTNLVVLFLAVRLYYSQLHQARLSVDRKLEHLEVILSSDNRWMSHDKVAETLTQRYIDALDDDWTRKTFQHSSTVRHNLGLEPDYGASPAVNRVGP